MKNAIRILCLLLALLLAEYAVAENAEDTEPMAEQNLPEEWILKNRSDSWNRVVTIEGKNFVFYAQNSPEYSKIWVGDGFQTNVGEGACASHALANTIVNSVPYENLPKIQDLALYPITIDTHNILWNHGIREEDSFAITRNEDFFRYFSLAILNIKGGNNREYFGRSVDFANAGWFAEAAGLFGLTMQQTYDVWECVGAVENGAAMAIVCSGGTDSIIANRFGHFFTMAYATEDRVYFLDSLVRDSFPLDTGGIIHFQEPGVLWVERQNVDKLSLYGTKYIVWPAETRTEYTPELYDEIIALSNTPLE